MNIRELYFSCNKPTQLRVQAFVREKLAHLGHPWATFRVKYIDGKANRRLDDPLLPLFVFQAIEMMQKSRPTESSFDFLSEEEKVKKINLK